MVRPRLLYSKRVFLIIGLDSNLCCKSLEVPAVIVFCCCFFLFVVFLFVVVVVLASGYYGIIEIPLPYARSFFLEAVVLKLN